jgi:hypothetical protein
MGRLESALQRLHDEGKPIEITWFWDDGVDVKAGDEMRNFRTVAEVLPWLRHWYSLKQTPQKADALETELQKIYDSEINITLRIGGNRISVALGNDFTVISCGCRVCTLPFSPFHARGAQTGQTRKRLPSSSPVSSSITLPHVGHARSGSPFIAGSPPSPR